MERTVVLTAFYNGKALGVRYLETALRQAGFRVVTVFFKSFHSARPAPATAAELELLCEKVRAEAPVLVGLSVMSSMYLETVDAVLAALLCGTDVPVVCGGAFATMFPAYFLDRGAAYVVRGDGERVVTALAQALAAGEDPAGLPSLCLRRFGQAVIRDIAEVEEELDRFGIPAVHSPNACLITDGRLTEGDPQRRALSYEVVASRGCPFTCAYCCCVNLRRLFPAGSRYVRTRSVESVMAELREARRVCRRVVFVHFYDEIFPNTPGWVDRFVEAYRREIGLPFTIWSHPKMLDGALLRKLVSAGLTEVIVGIQSGSERIRKDVFHRYETNEDILEANRVLQRSGVFWISYDLMLRHPFENVEDLKQTYALVRSMEGRYELQLHGLNFLPGTDIVQMAVDQGYYTPEEMEKILYGPMEAQFGAYWERDGQEEGRLWYDLICLWQFPLFRRRCRRYETDPVRFRSAIGRDRRLAKALARLRYLCKKSAVVLKSRLGRVNRQRRSDRKLHARS